jgi:hypothetical protein
MKHNYANANSTAQPWKKDEENIGKNKLCILTIMTFIREAYETCPDMDKKVGCYLKLFFLGSTMLLGKRLSHLE